MNPPTQPAVIHASRITLQFLSAGFLLSTLFAIPTRTFQLSASAPARPSSRPLPRFLYPVFFPNEPMRPSSQATQSQCFPRLFARTASPSEASSFLISGLRPQLSSLWQSALIKANPAKKFSQLHCAASAQRAFGPTSDLRSPRSDLSRSLFAALAPLSVLHSQFLILH